MILRASGGTGRASAKCRCLLSVRRWKDELTRHTLLPILLTYSSESMILGARTASISTSQALTGHTGTKGIARRRQKWTRTGENRTKADLDVTSA